MAGYWLFKSEPSSWSWDDMVKAGAKGTEWDGVRNYQARNFMRAMQVGDLGLFYHSVDEKQAVGIVRVIAPAHPDSRDDTGKWECVDVAAFQPLPRPVTLDRCKAEPRLAAMVLVNNSRLSVQPVSEAEWQVVCELAGLAPAPRAGG
jgi:predicted RNA-binding protein with PUA-like domain